VSPSSTRIRLGALALFVAAILFILYPAVRPWHDESTVDGAAASMSSNAWVAAHFFGMLGFIAFSLGLLAVHRAVGRTRAEPLAGLAVVVTWIGAGLTLPYFGAEDFALHAIARRSLTGNIDLLGLAQDIRYSPLSITMFGIGLVGLGAGAILAAVAVARSGVLPRWSGTLAAVGFALFIPQFFAGEIVRIGHGVLLAAGLAWLAVALWRPGSDPSTSD
jgi:hypothetical protein